MYISKKLGKTIHELYTNQSGTHILNMMIFLNIIDAIFWRSFVVGNHAHQILNLFAIAWELQWCPHKYLASPPDSATFAKEFNIL